MKMWQNSSMKITLKFPFRKKRFFIFYTKAKKLPLFQIRKSMKNTFLLLSFLLLGATVFSQNPHKNASISAYKIVSYERDTTFVDTTLNIHKKYKFNYLRRDNFGLLQFSNVGQTYNKLAYDFDDFNMKPRFVAQSHHFNYKEVEAINYYNVPTPLTELYYKTAYTQGQQMDAFFTVNTSPQLNFSIAYKGVRSLGKYQRILTSTGNFVFTSNYHTKNERYRVRGHFAFQDIMNQENGGLRDSSLELFINNDPEFKDRGRLDVKFEDAENKLKGTRYYLDQRYYIVNDRDSLSHTSLVIGNILGIENKRFDYRQNSPFREFGASYVTNGLYTKTTLEDFNTGAYVHFDQSLIGTVTASINFNRFNYGYNTALVLDEGIIPNRIIGDLITFSGGYKKEYRGFLLEGKAGVNISGDFDANFLQGTAGYGLSNEIDAKATIRIHSAAPNFNFLLYQSDYKNYNWKTNFKNIKTQELRFDLETRRFGNASVSYTGIDDYAFFAVRPNDSTPSPMQAGTRVNYLKVRAAKEFNFGRFGMDHTLMYQQVMGGENILNIPKFQTRNSFYYQDHWFKRALYLQTGVTFQYFTKYNMNAYDPVLAEFYVQNDQKLGGFPLVDLFFNAKIQQTRIYLIYENFTALFGGKNEYFAAPGYPYKDNVLRFGLVWNFFL